MNYTVKRVDNSGPVPLPEIPQGTFFLYRYRGNRTALYYRTNEGFVRLEDTPVGQAGTTGEVTGVVNTGISGTPVEVTIQVHDGGSR